MGAIAATYADLVIVTTDNPGFEDPEDICMAIMADLSQKYRYKFSHESDRKRAIELACAESQAKSIIAVLGKGPDTYQKIGDQCFYFSDTQVVQSLC